MLTVIFSVCGEMDDWAVVCVQLTVVIHKHCVTEIGREMLSVLIILCYNYREMTEENV